MRHHDPLLLDVLQLVPWQAFDRSVEKHAADRNVRTLSTKSPFVAVLHAQLSGATSLREIVTTMESQAPRLKPADVEPPKRSTLADANALRPAGVFAEVFRALLAQTHRHLRKTSKEAVRLIN